MLLRRPLGHDFAGEFHTQDDLAASASVSGACCQAATICFSDATACQLPTLAQDVKVHRVRPQEESLAHGEYQRSRVMPALPV